MSATDIIMGAAGASGPVNYIEDVFSTYLYTGNGSTQTITNGIDLATKGGLVWIKDRTLAQNNGLYDTVRGATKLLISNQTNAQQTLAQSITSFTSSGFSVGTFPEVNENTDRFASWTFRKQPKFFDVVTYTGNGTAGRTIAHNLGSVPGCIIVKCTGGSSGESWNVYHRSLGNNALILLDSTDPKFQPNSNWNNTDPTSTGFTVSGGGGVNYNGFTYVAYLFAHNAGGFGLTGTDNVISCGSFTGNTTVNLGYEPQWVLVKNYAGADSWTIMDNMRGMPVTGFSQALLRPNTAGAEGSGAGVFPTATGFTTTAYAGLDCIYIAIRRGPMKVPTDATKVFSPLAVNNATGTTNTTNFPIDMQISNYRSGDSHFVVDRLRGVSSNSTEAAIWMVTDGTGAEVATGAGSGMSLAFSNTGFNTVSYYNSAGTAYWNFRRAPSFFDEVCYTGTGVARTINHNLGVAPELMIVKCRSNASTSWIVYAASLGNTGALVLNGTDANIGPTNVFWNSTTPTSSVFSLANGTNVNANGYTFVNYLFATCAGVSKVGSYTGTGNTSQSVNCGFSAGSRFVLIKRTDSTGDWYVWDTARGLVSGATNDPYLLLNSTAAEVTNTNYVNQNTSGFSLVGGLGSTGNPVNISSATYIFLAIA